MFRQSEASGSGTVAGTNIVARGQSNQTRSVTLPTSDTGGQELPTVTLVATHIMEDAGNLVFVLGVANQAI